MNILYCTYCWRIVLVNNYFNGLIHSCWRKRNKAQNGQLELWPSKGCKNGLLYASEKRDTWRVNMFVSVSIIILWNNYTQAHFADFKCYFLNNCFLDLPPFLQHEWIILFVHGQEYSMYIWDHSSVTGSKVMSHSQFTVIMMALKQQKYNYFIFIYFALYIKYSCICVSCHVIISVAVLQSLTCVFPLRKTKRIHFYLAVSCLFHLIVR